MAKKKHLFSNDISISNRFILCKEILLIFSVFFLPGIIAQSGTFNPSLFNQWRYHFQYIIISVPQILLLLYILFIRKDTNWEAMGIKRLSFKEILLSFPAAVGIFIVLYVLTLLLSLLPAESQENLTGGFRWEFSNYAVIPLVILTSLVTGYREELFFRSYLISRLGRLGFPEWGGVLFSGMLFSAGHLYQGWAGFLVSFSIGIYFGFLFIYRRNIHFIAIAHALYNTAVLLLSNIIPEGEPQNYVDFFLNIL